MFLGGVKIFASGLRITKSMTPAQIAEAQRLARKWKPKKEGK